VEAIDTKKVSNDRTTKKTALQLMRHMKMIRHNPMTIDEAENLSNWFKSKEIHAVRIGKPSNRVKVHSGG
jgi:replicative DNA helicase